jgi:hypothetical protein
MRLAAVILFISSVLLRAASPQIVGSETAVTNRESLVSAIPNLRPGDGDFVTYNPPIFSWFYSPNYTNKTDIREWNFQFQISTNNSFTNPQVNVRTPWSMYNTFGPITNSNGSAWTNTCYWRVGYVDATNLTSTNWSSTYTFTILPGATNWDRSMLSTGSVASLTHPYIYFGSNQSTMFTFIKTNNSSWWLSVSNSAIGAQSLDWWVQATNWGPNANQDNIQKCGYVGNAAIAYGISRDGVFTNGVVRAFTNMATWFTNCGYWAFDHASYTDHSPITALTYGYDWLYPIMNANERAIGLAAVRSVSWFYNRGNSWRFLGTENGGIPNGADTTNGPFYVTYFSQAQMGSSHATVSHTVSSFVALAGINDDPENRMFYDMCINFYLGRTHNYGTWGAMNRSRSYAYEEVNLRLFWDVMVAICATFPSAKFERIPFMQNFPDFWSRMTPPGYNHLQEQWGDVRLNSGTYKPYAVMERIAYPARDGNALLHAQYQKAIDSQTPTAPVWEPFYFGILQPTTNNLLSRAYFEDGWVFGSSSPINTPDNFTNGVGFIFQARPRGSDLSHSFRSDLSFEIWAYGANITSGGGQDKDNGNMTYWSHDGSAHNTLLVSGQPMFQAYDGPRRPYYCQILNYTNDTVNNFAYVCADGTYGWPHESFDTGGWLTGNYPSSNPSVTIIPQNQVQRVRRHFVNPRRKYFVIYDELQSTTNTTFSWLYHIGDYGLSINTNVGTFRYPVNSWIGTSVTTLVAHCWGTNSLTWYNTSNNAPDNVLRPNLLQADNTTPTTNWNFLSVIYPVKPGNALPTITRITDNTVAITNGSESDVISFGETNALSTMVFNTLVAGTNDSIVPLASSRATRIVAGAIRGLP